MKKIILRLAAVLFALLVVGLIIVFFSLNSIVKKGVETVGPMLTKVEVRLGAAKVSPLSGSGELSEFFVGNPAGYKTTSAIKMGDIKVGLKVSSLLSDTIVVEEINIQGPEITFEGNLSGNNLSKILENLEAAAGGDTAPKPDKPEKAATKSEKRFFVKDVVMKGGKIHLSIAGMGGKEMTVALPEVQVQNIGTADKGATAAELSTQLLKPLLVSATKAAGDAMANLGKELKVLGKGSAEDEKKVIQGVKDLFKK